MLHFKIKSAYAALFWDCEGLALRCPSRFSEGGRISAQRWSTDRDSPQRQPHVSTHVALEAVRPQNIPVRADKQGFMLDSDELHLNHLTPARPGKYREHLKLDYACRTNVTSNTN